MIVLGIDPGGRNTGLVLRDTHRRRDTGGLLGHHLAQRRGDDIMAWIDHVLELAVDLAHLAADLGGGLDLIAIEDVVEPTPHMGIASVGGLIDTAIIVGACVTWAGIDGDPLGVLVRPNRHGSAAAGLGRPGLLACYPAALVGDGEAVGTGKLKDCRSAWDVAAAGAAQHLTRTLEEAP